MNSISSRENRTHSSHIKPFSYYKCIIWEYFDYVPMHWHSEFEINYIREGSAEFICGDEKFTSTAGDIIITQPNVMHSIYSCAGQRQVYDTLVFSQDVFSGTETDRYFNECIKPLINGSMRVKVHITPEHHYYSEFEVIMENIFACAKGDTPRLDMLMRSEIIKLFWLLETEAETDRSYTESDGLIRTAIEYIEEHFSDVIAIKQLASAVHLSESYFMSQFKKHVGLSAMEYISHFRINQACKLLAGTNKSVLEIAFDCGFRNISNFNRQFRRTAGCSPTEYRKKLSGENG